MAFKVSHKKDLIEPMQLDQFRILTLHLTFFSKEKENNDDKVGLNKRRKQSNMEYETLSRGQL
jgi:hypothetical protein